MQGYEELRELPERRELPDASYREPPLAGTLSKSVSGSKAADLPMNHRRAAASPAADSSSSRQATGSLREIGSQRASASGSTLGVVHTPGPPPWSSARSHHSPADGPIGACRRSSSATTYRHVDGGARAASSSTCATEAFGLPRSASREEHSEAIRVAVRVRPFNEQDRRMGFGRSCAISIAGQNVKVWERRDEDEYKEFRVDMTFWSHDPQGAGHATQEDVFTELGQPMLRGALAGYHGCLLAYGQTGAGKTHSIIGTGSQPGILPRLVEGLLQERSWAVGGGTGGSSTGGFELRVWLSAVEIFSERVRDLLSPIATGETYGVEDPSIVQHPMLGIQVLGATEAPCLEETDARKLLEYAAKKRAVSQGIHGGALSSRSHAFFFIRLDVRHGGRSMHSRLTLVDLAGSERSGSTSTPSASRPLAFAREGRAINRSLANLVWIVRELNEASPASARSHLHFQASKLTLALKEALSGNSRSWLLAACAPGEESIEESIATLRFAELVKQLRTCPRPMHGSWAEALGGLQEDTARLRVQLASGGEQELREPSAADRQRLLEELHRPRQLQADDGVRLAREREKSLEAVGLLNVDAEEAFRFEQVTPYFLNMSVDPHLTGCLLYFLRRGEETSIGGSDDCTIVINGLSVLPRLCVVENHDNLYVSLQRPDEAKRLVLLNGMVLHKDPYDDRERGVGGRERLHHHDRLFLGHSLVLRLHVPMQAEVGTIHESQEHTGVLAAPQTHELVLCSHPKQCLPVLPDRTQAFHELQLFMTHSESLNELQLYMEDLYDKLDPERGAMLSGHEFFRTLQEACHLIDEANALTRKVRPEDSLHFEVEFVWDIYRDVEDILMIRVMQMVESPRRGEDGGETQSRGDVVLHYWTYAKFRERLDMMRDVYFVFYHSGCWSGKGDVFEDPWIEPSTAELQQRLLQAVLTERRRAAAAADRSIASSSPQHGAVCSSGGRSSSALARTTSSGAERRVAGAATPPASPGPAAPLCAVEASGSSAAGRIRHCPRSIPTKERPGSGRAVGDSQSSRIGRQQQRAAKPHHGNPSAAAGPDACAGGGSSALGEQPTWSRANALPTAPLSAASRTTSAATSTVSTPTPASAAENERLREIVASLQRQLEAVQEKTDQFDIMKAQMNCLQSMVVNRVAPVGSAAGSYAANSTGAGTATPGSATMAPSIDGNVGEEQDEVPPVHRLGAAQVDGFAVPVRAAPSPNEETLPSAEAGASAQAPSGVESEVEGGVVTEGAAQVRTASPPATAHLPRVIAPVSPQQTVRRATPLRTIGSPPRPPEAAIPVMTSSSRRVTATGSLHSPSEVALGSPTDSPQMGTRTPTADGSAVAAAISAGVRSQRTSPVTSPLIHTRTVNPDAGIGVASSITGARRASPGTRSPLVATRSIQSDGSIVIGTSTPGVGGGTLPAVRALQPPGSLLFQTLPSSPGAQSAPAAVRHQAPPGTASPPQAPPASVTPVYRSGQLGVSASPRILQPARVQTAIAQAAQTQER